MGAVGDRQGNTDMFKQLFPFEFAGGPYHSFQYGPVHVTVMDAQTDYSPGSPQYQWLADDLRRATAPWKMVVHTGRHTLAQTSAAAEAAREMLHSLCEEYGVNLVIDGSTSGYAAVRVGPVQYVGLGPAPPEGENEPHTMVFGAVQIEGPTLKLEVFDHAGDRIESVEQTLRP